MRERGHRHGIGGVVGDRLEHSPGTRAQEIRDQARELDVRFFEQRLQRLCSCTRAHVSWYFRRVTVRQSRCSEFGTKLSVSS
jgi:hypothetical protein